MFFKEDFDDSGNHNPYIEEDQTTHFFPKERVQKDKQR